MTTDALNRAENPSLDTVKLPRDVAILELRRLLAEMENINQQAERENQLGGWQSDHTAEFYEANRAYHIIRDAILTTEGGK